MSKQNRNTVLPSHLFPTGLYEVHSISPPVDKTNTTKSSLSEIRDKVPVSSSKLTKPVPESKIEIKFPSVDRKTYDQANSQQSVDVPKLKTSEVWKKYYRFMNSNQAGPCEIAHDNTIQHRIVVVKEVRMYTGTDHKRKLQAIVEQKHKNVVQLLDIFPGSLSVHLVYESQEVSLHQIQATNTPDITEIDLAIFAKEILQGLEYMHSVLGIVYGQMSPRNILLSFNSCEIKLANIAISVLQPQQKSFNADIRSVGTLLVALKEPGTIMCNPESLELKTDDVSDLCNHFLQQTESLSLRRLLKHDFLLKSPGVERLRVFIYRAMELAVRESSL